MRLVRFIKKIILAYCKMTNRLWEKPQNKSNSTSSGFENNFIWFIIFIITVNIYKKIHSLVIKTTKLTKRI